MITVKRLLLLFSLLPVVAFAQVRTGIDVLEEEDGLGMFAGKRVGLLTNPTGVDAHLKSTIDIFYESPDVNLTTLFAPEHGVRGNQYAGPSVSNDKDDLTGLPVYSLHGKVRKPTPDMLRNVDVIVYDIQDVGCRSYTFISSLGLLMEAAAENDKEVVVLDRPNPLGGNKVEGPLVEQGYFSFVSQFAIPYIYGLTCGELATLINAERPAGKRCRLSVVKMQGWHRNMTFAQTGLPWVPTSPQIPTSETACFYPMTGICGELGALNIGVGYTLPFHLFAAKWIDAIDFANAMNNLNLPGLAFRPIVFQPFFGSASGSTLQGVQVYITDYEVASLTEVQFYAIQVLHHLYPSKDVFTLGNVKSFAMFDNVCGSAKVRSLFSKRYQFSDVQQFWRKDAAAFRKKSAAYFLYD